DAWTIELARVAPTPVRIAVCPEQLAGRLVPVHREDIEEVECSGVVRAGQVVDHARGRGRLPGGRRDVAPVPPGGGPGRIRHRAVPGLTHLNEVALSIKNEEAELGSSIVVAVASREYDANNAVPGDRIIGVGQGENSQPVQTTAADQARFTGRRAYP